MTVWKCINNAVPLEMGIYALVFEYPQSDENSQLIPLPSFDLMNNLIGNQSGYFN